MTLLCSRLSLFGCETRFLLGKLRVNRILEANRAVLSVFVTTTRESLMFRSFHDTSPDSLGSFVTSTAWSRCLLSDKMSSAAAGRSGNSRRTAHLSCFHKVCKIYPFDGKADQHASKMSQSKGYRLRLILMDLEFFPIKFQKSSQIFLSAIFSRWNDTSLTRFPLILSLNGHSTHSSR